MRLQQQLWRSYKRAAFLETLREPRGNGAIAAAVRKPSRKGVFDVSIAL
jgi:hypothetical protein